MWNDLRVAFAFLTVLPVGYPRGENGRARPGRSFAYFPLVGLVIGVLVSLIAGTSLFSRDFTAFFTLLTWVVLTGGLHLDGFGDSCDGLLATTTPERRLEIMKDPHAGTWAVTGLILLLLGKWAALREIDVPLILPPVIGRWVMVVAAYGFSYARTSGLGGYFREGLGRGQVITATGITLVTTALVSIPYGWRMSLTLVVGLLVAFGMGRWAVGRLNGGLTGDVYGALCELTEWGCLLLLSSV